MKLKPSLPSSEERNGLGRIAQEMIDHPRTTQVLIVVVDTGEIRENVDAGTKEAVARILRIEPIVDPEDKAACGRFTSRGYEQRTGQNVLPLEFEDEMRSIFLGDPDPESGVPDLHPVSEVTPILVDQVWQVTEPMADDTWPKFKVDKVTTRKVTATNVSNGEDILVVSQAAFRKMLVLLPGVPPVTVDDDLTQDEFESMMNEAVDGTAAALDADGWPIDPAADDALADGKTPEGTA